MEVIISALALASVAIYKYLKSLQFKWTCASKEQELGCKQAPLLSPDGSYFGLKHLKGMFDEYEYGTRNGLLQKTFKTFGTTYRTNTSGLPRILTVDLDNVKAVFGGSNDQWGVEPCRLEAFRPAFGKGVLITDGPFWQHARKLCVGIIQKVHKHRLSNLRQFDERIDRLVNLIPNGSQFDLQVLMFRYMIDSSTEYIFGQSVNSLLAGPEGEAGKDFLTAMLTGLRASGRRGETPRFTDMVLDKSNRDAFAVIHKMADYQVQAALQRHEAQGEKTDEVSLALEHIKAGVNSPKEIAGQLLNVLVAAFDTTAVTMSNAFFYLARNRAAYGKLRAEALAQGPAPSADDLNKLPYLQAVLKETLRLSTPATFNSRMALYDSTIPTGGGPDRKSPVFIPKGGVVITSIFSLQRDPKVFGEDADDFRPERWETCRPKHWEYLPFSAGPRVCPGQLLASTQSAYVLFQLARRFARVENQDPEHKFVEFYQVSTSSANGVKVSMFKD